MRTEEAERSIAVSSIRRRLGVMTVRCQANSLLGRMETLGGGRGGAAAAAGRRSYAAEVERSFQQERRAHELAARTG